MPTAFISHSSIDKPFVRRLRDDLKASGVNTWLDEEQISPGQSFVERINHGLADADFVLLVISKNFLSSEWTLWEANASIAAAVKAKADSVIPLLIENVWDKAPALLRGKVYVDFRDHTNVLEYGHYLAHLLSVLHRAKAPPIVKTRTPTVLVTGGRNPERNAVAFQVAYEFGKLLGTRRQQMFSGIAIGVDENFCRGATETLEAVGENARDYLTCYCGRGRIPSHDFGQQIMSVYKCREEGVPELVMNADIAVLFGGSRNTQYIGVLALLEDKVVFPVAATGGAAVDLHTIILSRYSRTFRDRLEIGRFRSLASINLKPADMAQKIVGLIDLCS